MTRKLVTNFFYQASYQLLLIILPIITIPVVSGALGPAGIGEYSYINSIAAYFMLIAGLGLANYGVREISIVRDNRKAVSRKFWELQIFNLFCSLTAFFVYIIIGIFTNHVLFYVITSMTVLSCVFDISWFFAGIEDFKLITIRNFIIKIGSFVLIVIFVNSADDLVIYFLISSVGTLLSEMSLWITIKKYVDFVRVPLKDCFAHFKPALEFFVAKIAITLYQNTTKTILGLTTTLTVVGYYTNAFTLVLMAGSIINSMNTIMIPRMSNLYGRHDDNQMVKMLQKSLHLQIFFTVGCTFGIILITNKLVPWLFGTSFLSLRKIIPLLAPVVIFQSFQMSVAAQYLIPRKEMRDYNISILVGAMLTIVITATLSPIIGIYAAVLGINAGYILVSYLRAKMLITRTDFKFEYSRILGFIVSGLIMWGVVDFVTRGMQPVIFTTFIQVLLGVVIYLLCTFLLHVNPLTDFLLASKFRLKK